MTNYREPDLWSDCMLEGDAINIAVARLLGLTPIEHQPPGYFYYGNESGKYEPSTCWEQGGPLIESNQVFLDAPHDMHRNFGGKRPNDWVEVAEWRATVSARVRTYPNPNFGAEEQKRWPGCVGRGRGPTPLIAAMRAIVASFGPSEAERKKRAAARADAPERDIEF